MASHTVMPGRMPHISRSSRRPFWMSALGQVLQDLLLDLLLEADVCRVCRRASRNLRGA